jgi:tetratricopeptide (TPR) repeat protein
MAPFDLGVSIEIAKLAWSEYQKLSVRQRVVDAAIRALVTDSLSELEKPEIAKIVIQFKNWSKSKPFLLFWKTALLNGCFDFKSACLTFKEANKFIPLVIDLETELMPHFLRHLEAHRLKEEKIFVAYRQANPEAAISQCGNLKPITLTENLPPSNIPRWQEWYTVLHNSEAALKKGRIQFAKEELRTLIRNEDFSQAAMSLKVSILRGLGEICTRLGENAPASEYLNQASLLDPLDGLTQTALSQLNIRTSNYENAFFYAEKAFKFAPKNEEAIATYLLACSLSNRSNLMFEYLASHPVESQDKLALVACGHAWAYQNDFEIAQTFYEQAFNIDKDDSTVQFLLSSCKLIAFQNSNTRLADKDSEAYVDAVNELAITFESLLENERASDYPAGRNKFIQGITATFALIDKWEESLLAIDTWYIEGDEVSIIGLKALILIYLGRLEESRDLLQKVENNSGRSLDITRFILAHEFKDREECLKILNRIDLYPQVSLEASVTNQVSKARILHELNRSTEAFKIIEPLLKQHDLPRACIFEILILLAIFQESEQFEELLNSALFEDEELTELFKAIAQEHINQNNLLMAASQLRRVPNIDKNHSVLTLLALVQDNAGLNKAATATAKKARLAKGECIAGVTEAIELRNYINSQNWQDALELVKILQVWDADNSRHFAGEALIRFYGFHDLKNARLALTDVDLDRIPQDLLMKLRSTGLTD